MPMNWVSFNSQILDLNKVCSTDTHTSLSYSWMNYGPMKLKKYVPTNYWVCSNSQILDLNKVCGTASHTSLSYSWMNYGAMKICANKLLSMF
jgi:hypothetical protein